MNGPPMLDWDQRYGEDGFAYGTAPNDFLVEMAGRLPKGRVLCLGEGEGRNAVYLAQQGLAVTALDASAVGLAKAAALAAGRGVRIETLHADLAGFEFEPGTWDGVVSIFCHLPPKVRARVHRGVVAGLRPGGVLVLEAYTPAQLALGTGGPPVAEMTMTLAGLEAELAGLEFVHALECEREVLEGKYHHGTGAVVQVVALKPR
jgi:SAM-dependent methyltransferase